MAQPPALFTFVPFPEAMVGPCWSFDCLQMAPLLNRSSLFTPHAADAKFHVIRHRQPFAEKGDYGGVAYYDWMAAHYPAWNEAVSSGAPSFLLFHFCDAMTHCGYAGTHGDWLRAEGGAPLDPAISPVSASRVVRHIVWNGRADGADAGMRTCHSCTQAARDIVVPTAENACGPFCGSNRTVLQRWAVWHSDTPRTLRKAREYVASWSARPHRVFWAGTVSPHLLAARGFEHTDDVSGRGVFYNTHRAAPGFFLHQTYDWDANKPTPLAVPMLELMRNATFCFSPLGTHGGDQDRYLPALLTGCIPIMLRSVYEAGVRQPVVFPFAQVIHWERIAVVIDADDVSRLPEILDAVDVADKRAHVFRMWRHLLWTSVYGSYLGETPEADAFHTLLRILQKL
jgi:hypothetical protein